MLPGALAVGGAGAALAAAVALVGPRWARPGRLRPRGAAALHPWGLLALIGLVGLGVPAWLGGAGGPPALSLGMLAVVLAVLGLAAVVVWGLPTDEG